MLFSQATLIFLILLFSTSSAAADHHARAIRRCDAGTASPTGYNTASPTGYNTTSTGAAVVATTVSNNSSTSISVATATAAATTASSWPMDLGPGVNASASLTFFTLYQNISHIYDGMFIPLPIVAYYGASCTNLEDLNTARGYYFSRSEAKKGQCKVWELPDCTGRVMEKLEGVDEPQPLGLGMAGTMSSFICWKS